MKKKIVFVLGIITILFTASAFIAPKKANTLPGPGDSCQVVGNCTVNLVPYGDGQYKVQAINYNNYPVTVEWSVIGYCDGKEIHVASGTLVCPVDTKHNAKYSGTFNSNCENVGLEKPRVLKCDY